MDLEEDLRRVLQARSDLQGGAVPLEAVHRGLRRRRRRQRLAVSGTAVAVVAVAALVTAAVTRTPAEPRPGSSVTDGTAVPNGFQIKDLTYLSTQDGYALGSLPCAAGSCPAMLQTDAGGSRWSLVDAPPGTATAAHVRFARDVDGNRVGYAFGPGLATYAGGTWTASAVPSAVEALEAASDGVVRVRVRPGGGHLVERARVGGRDWQQVLDVPAKTPHALLARQGDRLALVTFDSDVSDIRTSADGGQTWTKGAHDPCSADAQTRSVALGAGQQVLVLCGLHAAAPGGTASYVRVSPDSGHTFGAPVPVASGFSGTQLTAPARGGWLVAADGSSGRVVLRSPDQGRAWEQVATERSRGGATGYLDISNSSTVTWVGSDARVLWRSTDAGATWTSYTFH